MNRLRREALDAKFPGLIASVLAGVHREHRVLRRRETRSSTRPIRRLELRSEEGDFCWIPVIPSLKSSPLSTPEVGEVKSACILHDYCPC